MIAKRALTLLFLAAAIAATASPANAASGRWWGGGGIGLAFGGNVDWVSVEPVIGYSATTKLSVGARLILRYRNDKRFAEDFSTTDYGASIFTRYFLTKQVFLQGEYEYLSYEFPTGLTTSDREGFGSWLGGAGFSQGISRNASFFVLALYNFSYDENERSPYSDPWVVRAGVGFRF